MNSPKNNEYFVITPQDVFEGCGGDTSHGSAAGENYLLKNNRYNGDGSCQPPQDSDSGISNDGYQIIEDLQSELKEKDHLANKLKSMLEFTDRQHEEAIAVITAERDSLQGQLNILRSENTSLTNAKHDFEECYERMCASESALEEMRQELETLRRQNKQQEAVINELEGDKITLQELLSQSKAECHRTNELYSNRQSSLREENETLKTQCAELTSKIEDQDELVQHLMREKVKAEMELKDAVNRSNFARMDTSIEVSYTEDQMLHVLDSLNTDRFSQNEKLNQDEFNFALKEDCGRLSLFDELRLSTSVSRITHYDTLDCSKCVNKTIEHVSTQTDDILDNKRIDSPTYRLNIEDLKINNNQDVNCKQCNTCKECDKRNIEIFRLEKLVTDLQCDLTQYQENLELLSNLNEDDKRRNLELETELDYVNTKLCEFETAYCNQTEDILSKTKSSNTCAMANVSTQIETSCAECEKREVSQLAEPPVKRTSWTRKLCNTLWSTLAVLCFMGAIMFLYNVSSYHYEARRCGRGAAVPWRWLTVNDLLDLVIRVEYVGEVPR